MSIKIRVKIPACELIDDMEAAGLSDGKVLSCKGAGEGPMDMVELVLEFPDEEHAQEYYSIYNESIEDAVIK